MKKFMIFLMFILVGLLVTSAVASDHLALGGWEWKGGDNENVLVVNMEDSGKFSGHFLNRRGGEDGVVSSFSLEKINLQGEKISFNIIPRRNDVTECDSASVEGTVINDGREMALNFSPVKKAGCAEKGYDFPAVFKKITPEEVGKIN